MFISVNHAQVSLESSSKLLFMHSEQFIWGFLYCKCLAGSACKHTWVLDAQ